MPTAAVTRRLAREMRVKFYPFEIASRRCGLDVTEVRDWLRRGIAGKAEYEDFAREILQATIHHVTELNANLKMAIRGDGPAIAWLVRYSRRVRKELDKTATQKKQAKRPKIAV
jgi:hypothetical protein